MRFILPEKSNIPGKHIRYQRERVTYRYERWHGVSTDLSYINSSHVYISWKVKILSISMTNWTMPNLSVVAEYSVVSSHMLYSCANLIR